MVITINFYKIVSFSYKSRNFFNVFFALPKSKVWLRPWFRPDADKNMRVCDLFNPDTRQWRLQLFSHTFMTNTVADIQHINLGTTTNRDKLIWKENRKGIFSFKSAYQATIRTRQTEQVEHSSARQDKKLWNRIW